MDVSTSASSITCAKGTNSTASGVTGDAWYTVILDTVPGAGAGGGGGDPINPTAKPDSGWSMETKMMALWAALAVAVVGGLAAYYFYARYRRSQAMRGVDGGGLLGGDHPVISSAAAGADPHGYTAM